MIGVRFAPSAAQALWRTLLILAAGALVSLGVYAVNGAPSASRVPAEGPGALYGPGLWPGLAQFIGWGAAVAAGVYVARRWLRVRL
ncbi:MAG TPA: hypothetical protein VMT93_09095 [Gemmatimonadaceae bacterium]|nr:hypothetical protein [Gemmatimonadaceae bacterium]